MFDQLSFKYAFSEYKTNIVAVSNYFLTVAETIYYNTGADMYEV